MLLQGLTAHYLSHDTYAIRAGETVLIHAGAGGVGLLLTQMAKRLGARVLTTVSTEQKAELSRVGGCGQGDSVYDRELCGRGEAADGWRWPAGGV